jgi:hypothetical protein
MLISNRFTFLFLLGAINVFFLIWLAMVSLSIFGDWSSNLYNNGMPSTCHVSFSALLEFLAISVPCSTCCLHNLVIESDSNLESGSMPKCVIITLVNDPINLSFCLVNVLLKKLNFLRIKRCRDFLPFGFSVHVWLLIFLHHVWSFSSILCNDQTSVNAIG